MPAGRLKLSDLLKKYSSSGLIRIYVLDARIRSRNLQVFAIKEDTMTLDEFSLAIEHQEKLKDIILNSLNNDQLPVLKVSTIGKRIINFVEDGGIELSKIKELVENSKIKTSPTDGLYIIDGVTLLPYGGNVFITNQEGLGATFYNNSIVSDILFNIIQEIEKMDATVLLLLRIKRNMLVQYPQISDEILAKHYASLNVVFDVLTVIPLEIYQEENNEEMESNSIDEGTKKKLEEVDRKRKKLMGKDPREIEAEIDEEIMNEDDEDEVLKKQLLDVAKKIME